MRFQCHSSRIPLPHKTQGRLDYKVVLSRLRYRRLHRGRLRSPRHRYCPVHIIDHPRSLREWTGLWSNRKRAWRCLYGSWVKGSVYRNRKSGAMIHRLLPLRNTFCPAFCHSACRKSATAVSSRLKADGRSCLLINQSLRNIFPYYNKLFTVHLSFSSWAFNSSRNRIWCLRVRIERMRHECYHCRYLRRNPEYWPPWICPSHYWVSDGHRYKAFPYIVRLPPPPIRHIRQYPEWL